MNYEKGLRDSMKYDLIYKHVAETKSFGVETVTVLDGVDVGMSMGIRYLIKHEPKALEQIEQALERFYNADFGTMFESEYEKAFMPTHWQDKKAFGEYEIDALDDMPIYIHYEPYGMAYDTVIYLCFER